MNAHCQLASFSLWFGNNKKDVASHTTGTGTLVTVLTHFNNQMFSDICTEFQLR